MAGGGVVLLAGVGEARGFRLCGLLRCVYGRVCDVGFGQREGFFGPVGCDACARSDEEGAEEAEQGMAKDRLVPAFFGLAGFFALVLESLLVGGHGGAPCCVSFYY